MSSSDAINQSGQSGQPSTKVKVKLTKTQSIVTYNPKHAISLVI